MPTKVIMLANQHETGIGAEMYLGQNAICFFDKFKAAILLSSQPFSFCRVQAKRKTIFLTTILITVRANRHQIVLRLWHFPPSSGSIILGESIQFTFSANVFNLWNVSSICEMFNQIIICCYLFSLALMARIRKLGTHQDTEIYTKPFTERE